MTALPTLDSAPIASRVAVRDALVDHESAAGSVRALGPVSFSADAGSSLAVMGPSGCGKSTLLGLLAGLALPTSGSIIVGDDIVSDLDDRGRIRFRRDRIGMVYQADNLLPHLTVEENVGLQLAICHRRSDARAENPTAAILDRLGIGALARRLPDQLSGGQRQRVAVARAVVHRPAIVLADEPTGALDDRSALAVIELLVEVQRAIGATLVMVTHDPDMAAHLDHTIQLPVPTGGPGRAHSLRPR